jgi:uncharacterized protein YndB with AHSA1/START domain
MDEKSQPREHKGRKVEKELTIEATPMAVWKAWADADGISQWFVDRAEGDAAAGEIVTWHFDTFGHQQPTPCVEARPGEALAFAGEIPGRLPFLLEVLLEQAGGSTLLRLVNSGFGEDAEWDDEYEGVSSGWGMALATLKHWLEGHRGEQRSHILRFRPASFEFDALQPFIATSVGLERWLASGVEVEGEALTEGATVRMELQDGGTLTGKVLARTRMEVLLSWEEQNGVIALKCFDKPPEGRHVALDFNAWPLAEGQAKSDLQARFDAALARLADVLA